MVLTKPKKIKNLDLSKFSQRSSLLVFAIVFGILGTIFILISQAATTTQIINGKLTTKQITQSFPINADNGQFKATLSASQGSFIFRLIKTDGTVVATQTGPSPLTISAATIRANYSLEVKSSETIPGKGLPYTINTTYDAVDLTAPSAPSQLSAQAISGSQINLSWGASTDNIGVVGYDIYRDGIKVGTSLNTTYQDKNLKPLITYKYYVVAQDAASNASKASSTIRVKTLSTPSGDTNSPTVPASLTAVAEGFNSVNLNWSPSTDDSGIEPRYDIYLNGNLRVTTVSATSYQDTGLTSGATYSYYIIARDDSGNLSGPSTAVSVTLPVPDTQAPTAPSNVLATPINSKQVNLSWTGSTDNVGVAAYTIFANGTVWATVTGTTYEHKYLTSDTAYSYYVVARDAANNSSQQSNTVSVRTPIADTERPTSPGSFTANATSSTEVSLNWTGSTDNVGVAGYRLYRDDKLLVTLNPSMTSYIDSSVLSNKAYTYAVEAFDPDGNTSRSYRRVYTPSAISIAVSSPSSGSTQAGMISVNGTTSASSGQVTKVEIAGSYGSYTLANGTTNWTAEIDTTKILDSTTPILDDPQHPDPISRYIFIKATNTNTGDFKIYTLPIIIKNDTVPPTATVMSPSSGSNQTGLYTITGTAADNVGVKKVVITNSSGQGGEVDAIGTTNWSATVTTEGNTYYPFDTVVVYDLNGNSSKTHFNIAPIHKTYSGTISGRTYKDQNNNHIYDSGDQALAGHVIYLYAAVDGSRRYIGQYIGNVSSDSEGKFSFSELQDGNYTLAYSASSWWTIDDNWFPNNPAVTPSMFSPKQIVNLSGTATGDFSWRPIARTPDPNQPGASLLITSLTGPNGMTANQYDDAITAQEIYNRASAGKLIGAETSTTSVGEGVYFGGGFAGTTGAGYGTDENGRCTGASGSSAIYWPYWYGYADDGDEGVLFHEYGHSWQNYWSCQHQDINLVEYMSMRGFDLADPRLNTNHEWSLMEIVAEDYRQLFSAKPIRERQENRSIPRATEIPGFKDYLTTTYRTAR